MEDISNRTKWVLLLPFLEKNEMLPNVFYKIHIFYVMKAFVSYCMHIGMVHDVYTISMVYDVYIFCCIKNVYILHIL